MLARLLELGKKEKYAFWAFFVGSYTYVLFSFVVEQYIMAYFYVVLTIYVWKNSEKKNYAYFGAVSTMLTSGVLFPMITKKKKWKEGHSFETIQACFCCYPHGCTGTQSERN